MILLIGELLPPFLFCFLCFVHGASLKVGSFFGNFFNARHLYGALHLDLYGNL